MATVFTDEKIEFIRNNADKMKIDEIAKAVKIKRGTLYAWSRRNNIVLKSERNSKKALSVDEIEYIKKHAMTLKAADIAKGIGRTANTVSKYIQKYNIPHKKFTNGRIKPFEINYIKENAGSMSAAEIARNLGRSGYFVLSYMHQFGLRVKKRRTFQNKICPWSRPRNNGYNQNPITDTTKMLIMHYYVENSEKGLSEHDNIANICNYLNRAKSDILAILAETGVKEVKLI